MGVRTEDCAMNHPQSSNLLVADDGARAADAQPRYGLQRRPAPVLHDIAADERPGAPQPRLAVHRHGSRRLLAHPQESDGREGDDGK